MKNLFNWLCLLAIVTMLLIAAAGCNTQKHVNRGTVTIDSTAVLEKQDSIRLLKLEIGHLRQEIRELQFSGVTFDSTDCLDLIKDLDIENCNTDSLYLAIANLRNKVKIHADGTIEAEGRIKAANYSRDKLTRLVASQQRIIDSLAEAKQKERVEYRVKTEWKEKQVERTVFPGWMWWLILLGIAAGWWLRGKIFKK